MKDKTLSCLVNMLALIANIASTHMNIWKICTAPVITGHHIFMLDLNLFVIFFIIYAFRGIEHWREIGLLQVQNQQLQLDNVTQTIRAASDMIRVYEATKQELEKPKEPDPEPELPRPVTTGALQFMELSDKETK